MDMAELWKNLGPVVAALILGGLVGLEREVHKKPAGLRTNMMICMAATVFTILAKSTYSEEAESRVMQGIITGVGFLGAGALMHTSGNVHGMTTAATIWLVTSVGIACGLERYDIAVIVTVLAIAILWGLSPLDKRLNKNKLSGDLPKK